MRITPQLVRVADESQLWAATYDRQIADIFEVQSNIAGEVIDQLGITLAGGERAALEERPTDNLEAYHASLMGKEARVHAELGRSDEALDLIEKPLVMTYDDSITLADLRLDPSWDKLREDARFRALVGH